MSISIEEFTYEVFQANIYNIQIAVDIYGGSFIKYLAEALVSADRKNQRKLYDGWKMEWYSYFVNFAGQTLKIAEAQDEQL